MKPLIVANWKMNPLKLSLALKLAILSDKKNIIICPPFVYLKEIKEVIRKAKIGAQDCSWQDQGSFTGDISPVMLKNIGCRYIIIGHSERRLNHNENNTVINSKIKTVLKAKLIPILCIGETKKNDNLELIIKKQITEAFNGLSLNEISKIIIAYEPVWSIGSGNNCHPDKAEQARIIINNISKNKILYGGSVNSENCCDYLKKALFNGLLIGNSSISFKEMEKIINKI